MEDICGTFNCFGENCTLSDILSVLVLGIYVLWHIYCSMNGPMYQQSYTCIAHDDQSFGILCITIIVPGGANDMRLQSNSLNMWV